MKRSFRMGGGRSENIFEDGMFLKKFKGKKPNVNKCAVAILARSARLNLGSHASSLSNAYGITTVPYARDSLVLQGFCDCRAAAILNKPIGVRVLRLSTSALLS